MPYDSAVQESKVLAVVTQGVDSGDADRLDALLSQIAFEMVPFDRESKGRTLIRLIKHLFQERPDLVVMEGTGIAGGLAVLVGRWFRGIPYVVSSGDAVGPFVAKFHPIAGLAFSFYERLLCRYCAGFVGWTPYLVGRAITFGAPRGMTAAGWAPFEVSEMEQKEARRTIRRQLGIPEDHVVVGIAGSLVWNPRVGYCYGYELVKAVMATDRPDIHVLIVGDGDGRSKLEELAGDEIGRRVVFTGRVPRDHVPRYLAAMDAASLPQSIDGVGNFRYTTKVSEYLSIGLPILVGHLPLAYDFPRECFVRLPGDTPWGELYIAALRQWMESATAVGLRRSRDQNLRVHAMFDRNDQIERMTDFIGDLLSETHAKPIRNARVSDKPRRKWVGSSEI